MEREAGRKLFAAIVKLHTARKHFAHHRDDVVDFERDAHHLMRHVPSCRIRDFGVLQMERRLRKNVVVAAMIVVQVRDDDVPNLVRLHANRLQPLGDRPDNRASALFRHRLVETGVHHERAVRAADHPDEIRERLEDVVRIAEQKVFRRLPVVVRVTDGENLVNVSEHVGHGGQHYGLGRKP